MEIVIDKLTPCLEKVKDHSIVDTDFKIATKEELKSLKKWQFKWTSKDLHECEIYKLTVNGDERIQGLVAIQDIHGSNAVYVKIAESAPHNIGINKEYLGVGGHLFAIAVQRSYDLGYNGFVYMDAKNLSLVKHYSQSLGAILIGQPHPYRMIIDEETAYHLINTYNFRRDENV